MQEITKRCPFKVVQNPYCSRAQCIMWDERHGCVIREAALSIANGVPEPDLRAEDAFGGR